MVNQGPYEILSGPYSRFKLEDHPLVKEADVIHLHWINDMVDLSFFRTIDKPIVWTLHDMNAFMGIFHYSTDKQKVNSSAQALDKQILELKAQAYTHLDRLAVVTPSKWLLEEAQASAVFPQADFYHIANPISFAEANNSAIQLTSAANTAIVIAQNLLVERKGMQLLKDALTAVDFPLTLFVLGKGNIDFDNPNIKVESLGVVRDFDRISAYYEAADVLILPSIEDNLPNTMVEALRVGTPIVSFRVGGMKETLRDEFNGLMAASISAEALGQTLDKFFKEKHQYNRNAIREDAKLQFEAKTQALKYLEVYKTLTP